MDYKKIGVIRDDEFNDACVPSEQCSDFVARQDCLFEGNSLILLKQAVHYTHSYGTNYVAFFD